MSLGPDECGQGRSTVGFDKFFQQYIQTIRLQTEDIVLFSFYSNYDLYACAHNIIYTKI